MGYIYIYIYIYICVCVCVMNILLTCLIMFGPWSMRNFLKSLGGVSGSCFSGRDVI